MDSLIDKHHNVVSL